MRDSDILYCTYTVHTSTICNLHLRVIRYAFVKMYFKFNEPASVCVPYLFLVCIIVVQTKIVYDYLYKSDAFDSRIS